MRLPRTSHRLLRPAGVAALVAGLALVASACGVTDSSSGDAAADAGQPLSDLRIMVPNTPGGGYDITARTAAKVMEDDEITSGTEVFNLEGAGGTVGLARTVNEKGNADLTMLMGLGVVGASYTNNSKATLAETTPIARLIEEYGAVMVPKGSPFKTIDDLVTAWKADPGSISVGGGSSPGGPDHLLPMQLAAGGRHRPHEGQLRAVRRRRRPAPGDPRLEGRRRHLRRRRVQGPDRQRRHPGAGHQRRRADRRHRRPDLQGGRHRPGLHQLARRRGSPRHHRRARRSAWSTPSRRCTRPRSGRTRSKANSWADAFQTSDQFGEFLTEPGQAGRGHAERAGAGMSQAVSPTARTARRPPRAGGRPPARGGRRGGPRRRAPDGRPHDRLGPGRPPGLPARRRRAAPGLRRGAGPRRAARRPRGRRGG